MILATISTCNFKTILPYKLIDTSLDKLKHDFNLRLVFTYMVHVLLALH